MVLENQGKLLEMSRTIQFTVSDEKRREIDIYAEEKGFRTASNLALYALTQHMRRYPLLLSKSVRAVQPLQLDANSKGITDGDQEE